MVATVKVPVPCTRRNTLSVTPLSKAEPSAVPTAATVNAESPEPAEPCDVLIYAIYSLTYALVIFVFAILTISSRPTSA